MNSQRLIATGAALLCLLGGRGARAGTLTGKFVTPLSGPVANGMLLLTLSQAAVVPGSFAIVPQTVSCSTSTDGSVVGVPNPLTAPTAGAFTGVGTLAGGTYFVKIVYTGISSTVTLASPELALALASTGELRINAPTVQPGAATGYAVYIGASSGAETLQGSVAGFESAFTQSTPLAAGAVLPGQNNTVCVLAFNDTTIPSYTYYTATLDDSAGNTLPGYPQNWYLGGSSIDVSTLEPLATNPAARFPMPVLANPAADVAQSVNSPLNLNQHGILNSGNVGPGFFSSFWAGTLPGPTTAVGGWTPNTPVELQRIDLYAQTAGAGGTNGLNVTVTDGTSSCTFQDLLAGTATEASTAPAAFGAGCTFNAGVPLTVNVASDDHTTRPGNVSWQVEMTSK
ncbi:MAG TPA: hypothetical protein VNE83_02150 [Terriglobales bacterium]|nr:hypothetical protein [Terriglobales bacterium]